MTTDWLLFLPILPPGSLVSLVKISKKEWASNLNGKTEVMKCSSIVSQSTSDPNMGEIKTELTTGANYAWKRQNC